MNIPTIDNLKKKAAPALILLCLAALQAGAQEGGNFNWKLGLENYKNGEMLEFSAPIQSQNGEQFRLVIESGARCFCYVVVESPGNEMAVLYSGVLREKEPWYSPVMELSDPNGTESFFFVMSGTEQKSLSGRLSAIKGSASARDKRAAMNEIFRLRREISRFKETPEVPVLMGGASRGGKEKPLPPEKSRGREFAGLETYVKTISIRH